MALVLVDGRDVIRVDETVPAEGAQHLRDGIARPTAQRQSSKETVRQCDGGVQISTGVASDVDSEHHSGRPP